MLGLRHGSKPLVYGIKIEEKGPDYEQKFYSGPKQMKKTTTRQVYDSIVTVFV